MLPLITVQEARSDLLKTTLFLLSAIGIALFFISMAVENYGKGNLDLIYRHGLYYYIGLLILHFLPKVLRLVVSLRELRGEG